MTDKTLQERVPMAATRNDILGWLTDPAYVQLLGDDDSRYCIIVCDTFDWEDYPVYATDEDDVRKQIAELGPMQKVMEVYDLLGDIPKQMDMKRAYAVEIPGFKKNV